MRCEAMRSAVADIRAVACVLQLDHMNVVSFRNNFNKLMATPYAPNDAYEIDIHRLYGRLYFGVRHLDLDKVSSSLSLSRAPHSISDANELTCATACCAAPATN